LDRVDTEAQATLLGKAKARAPVVAGGRDGVTAEGLRAAVEGLSSSRREPEWLLHLRRSALKTYSSLPLPDRVGHLWRYTEPERFVPGGVPSPPEAPGGRPRPSELPPELAAPLAAGDLAGAALVASGKLGQVTVDARLARAGVVIEDLHQAARTRPDLVRRHLGALVPPGKFEALNAALWRGGLLIHVPPGIEVEKPLHLLNLVEGGPLEAPRVLIVVEEGSSLTVIDEYAGGEHAREVQVYAVVEAFAGPSARLRHILIQRLGHGATIHLAQRSRLLRDAKLVSVVASLGASVAKADLGTLLEGQGAEVELTGFLFGKGRQHFDHHTVHDHRAPHTLSDLDFKVVLKDRSRSAYTGLIRIAPEAPSSEAYQENRNLFLNEGVKAESIPELEILTDEVMCTHGATMGSLDPEHLFYLASRGIPRREAARMIVGGFIEPTLNRLPEDLRERLRVQVEAGLESI